MQDQLAAIIAQLEHTRTRVRRLATQTPDSRWATRTAEDSWSVAECIAHLNLTSREYLALLRPAIAEHAVASAPVRRYRRDVIGWVIGYAAGPLPRIGRRRVGRAKTLAPFVPAGTLSKGVVLADFQTLQDEQIALVHFADSRPLQEIMIPSPFVKGIAYNAYSTFIVLARHQRRHLDQAEGVWRAC